VTLVVDDGHAVAHKILLATCSPLLSSIMELSTNTGVVYLNNISIKNLNLVLDFMYTGEANVDNEDLHEFLAAASTLKVRGLTEIVHEDEMKKEELKVNTLANKRKSEEPSSASKHKRKVLENDAEPILSIIQNENEPLKENKSLLIKIHNMEMQAGMKTIEQNDENENIPKYPTNNDANDNKHNVIFNYSDNAHGERHSQVENRPEDQVHDIRDDDVVESTSVSLNIGSAPWMKSQSVRGLGEKKGPSDSPMRSPSVIVPYPSRTPMFEDDTLPQGWHRKVSQRKSGASAGRYDVLIIGPTQQKFRSRNELKNFFNKTGETSLNPKQFDFSIFGRNNPKGPTDPTFSGHKAMVSTSGQTNQSTTPTMSHAWTGLYCEPVLQDSQTIKRMYKMNEGGPQGTFDNGIQGSSFEQEVIEVIDISLEDSPDATLVSDPIQADSSSSVQLPPRSTLPPHTSSSRSIQLPPGIKLPPSISLTSVDNSSYKKRKLSTPEYLRFK